MMTSWWTDAVAMVTAAGPAGSKWCRQTSADDFNYTVDINHIGVSAWFSSKYSFVSSRITWQHHHVSFYTVDDWSIAQYVRLMQPDYKLVCSRPRCFASKHVSDWLILLLICNNIIFSSGSFRERDACVVHQAAPVSLLYSATLLLRHSSRYAVPVYFSSDRLLKIEIYRYLFVA